MLINSLNKISWAHIAPEDNSTVGQSSRCRSFIVDYVTGLWGSFSCLGGLGMKLLSSHFQQVYVQSQMKFLVVCIATAEW